MPRSAISRGFDERRTRGIDSGWLIGFGAPYDSPFKVSNESNKVNTRLESSELKSMTTKVSQRCPLKVGLQGRPVSRYLSASKRLFLGEPSE